MRTILFVCTGNTCRSPMAEAIARYWLSRGLLGDEDEAFVASAGISAMEGARTSPETLRTLRGLDLEHDGRAKRLTAAMIRRAELVFGMTAAHVEAARDLVADDPDEQAKIMPLDDAGDLDDPIGMGQEAYDDLARRLMELIPRRLKETMVS